MTRLIFTAVIVSLGAFPQTGWAQNSSSIYHLHYGYRAWNKDPQKIDSASILMRDKNTGRLVQIRLQETAPDSSLFSGVFSIHWSEGQRLATEFFVPPQSIIEEAEGFKKLQQLIQGQKLTSKPFILRTNAVGDHIIEIFDTQEQAQQAQALFEEEQRLRQLQTSTTVLRRSGEGLEGLPLEEKLLQSALTTEEQKELTYNRTQVLRQEQLERQERIERLSSFRFLPPETQRAQREEAKRWGAQGLKAYRDGQIAEAALHFEKSRSLDPTLGEYDFQYGAALYRLGQYVRALAILKMVESDKVPRDELLFYLGLSHYHLHDLVKAQEAFQNLLELERSQLTAPSSFYLGLIHLRLKETDKARAQFHRVIEVSQEASLKTRAQEYLAYTQRLEAYQEKKTKRWSLAGALGAIYDSNVLLTSDSLRDQGLATDSEALRSLIQVQAEWRAHQAEKSQWGAQFSVLNLHSRKLNFESSAELERTDPTILKITAPYSLQGKWGGRTTQWQIAPGYEHILMNLDGAGTKAILQSPLLNLSTTVVMGDNWLSSYHLKLRHDDSGVEAASPADNTDAFKVELKYSNVYYTQKDRGQFLMPEVGYVYNAAEGDAQVYYRIDLSLAYIFPWIWGAHWNLQTSYYLATYPNGVSEGAGSFSARSEQNTALGLGFNKPLGKHWSWMVHSSYIKNAASVDDYSYSKFNVLTSFGFSY